MQSGDYPDLRNDSCSFVSVDISSILLSFMEKITFLPEGIYFPVEEFLALNTNHNSPIFLIGSFLIFICTLICSLKFNGKLQKSYEYILIAVIIFLTEAMMLPCLCAPVKSADGCGVSPV